MTVNPFELRDTAISAGLDPSSLTVHAARRRTSDAGLGRDVVLPVYVRHASARPDDPVRVGLLVRVFPGGALRLAAAPVVPLGTIDDLWRRVHAAASAPGGVAARDGWSRIKVGDVGIRRDGSLVLRTTDWDLLRAALALRFDPPPGPQDAPAERVVARFLGRLDGLDGTPSAGLWGRLALEVVSVRHPERLADTLSLRWHAAWGRGGFGAGSDGRAEGAGGDAMLLDLRHQQFRVHDRPFRVRTLPDWEREQAAHDLGLAPRRLLAWPVLPLATVVGYFDDITPSPLDVPEAPAGPQDAR